jgi:hypothetical protein
MGRKSAADKELRHAVIDVDTGEVVPALVYHRKKWKGERFFMGFQSAFADIAKKRLGSEAKDVFLLILGRMDYNNMLPIPQSEIARQLGMKKQNVSRAITTLIKAEVLRIDPRFSSKYRRRLILDREVAWKGKLKHLGEKERDYRKRNSKKSDEGMGSSNRGANV